MSCLLSVSPTRVASLRPVIILTGIGDHFHRNAHLVSLWPGTGRAKEAEMTPEPKTVERDFGP